MSVPAVNDAGALSHDARAWVAERLGGAVVVAESLAGGRNNRAFRVETRDGRWALCKAYFRSEADSRDRLGHEFEFARFAWERGVRTLPEPIAADEPLNVALYGFVPGRMLESAEVTPERVGEAIAFFRALNTTQVSSQAAALPPGSEACFTNIDHVALVDRRVRSLDAITDPGAGAFLERELKPYWASIHPAIAKADDAFTPTPTCVSPSDFGFHNAILRDDDGTLVFHDFEYAGQDDPAKLLGDFFHQPRVPAPPATYEAFEDAVIGTLGLDNAQRERFRALLPVYRVKWCGIVLAPLLTEAAERRKFAGVEIKPCELVERAAALLHQPLATNH